MPAFQYACPVCLFRFEVVFAPSSAHDPATYRCGCGSHAHRVWVTCDLAKQTALRNKL